MNYASAFFKKAAEITGEPNRVAALTLLANACCLGFAHATDADALGPPHALAALTQKQLSVLFEFCQSCTDPELQARIADLEWIRVRDRHAAELAVEQYIGSARRLEDPENWCAAFDRIERAVRLAAKLGKGNAPYSRALSYVEEVLARLGGVDPLYFSIRLIQLLLE